MTMNKTIWLASVAMIAAPQALHAQGTTGEIVVTAQKRSESILKAPIAITAIVGDELRNKGVNTVADLQDVVPGVSFQSTQDGINIGIRGVRSSDTSSKGEADIGFNVDGVYIGRGNARGTAFFDVERVEVLRGPQGTLYGRSTTGGAINLITVKPKIGQLGGYARLEYGNYDTKRGEAALNVPINDTLALRFAGAFNDRDGYTNPVAYAPTINGVVTPISAVGAKAFNDQHDATGRASLLYKPSADVTARLTGTFGHQGGVGGSTQVESFLATGSLNVYATPYGSWVNNNFANVDSSLNAKLGAVQLDLLASYQHFTLNQQRPQTNNIGYNGGVLGGILQIGKADTVQVEARLSNAQAQRLEYVAGANYFYENIYESGRLWNAPVATVLDTSTWGHQFEVNNHTPHKAYGLFGQGTFHATDKLSLVAGARYTHEEVTRTGTIAPGPCFVVNYPDACPAGKLFIAAFGYNDANNGHSTDNKVTWKLGVNYQADASNLIFASVSTGFKGGGFSDFGLVSGQSTTPYKPSAITAYELGYKGKPWRGLTLTSDLFYYDYSADQITGVTTVAALPGVQGQFTFTPPVEIYGWENEVSYALTAHTTISGTASYTHSRFVDFLAGSIIGNQVSWRGYALDQTPGVVLTGSLDHTIELSDDTSIKFHGQIKYSDGYALSDYGYAVRMWQKASTRSTANITYSFGKGAYSAQVFVENIENKVQRVGGINGYLGPLGGTGGSASTYGNGTIPVNTPAGYINFATTMPRLFGLRLNAKF
jgi:iron complex outermembrane receptor protein